jgi:streptogramin lyase
MLGTLALLLAVACSRPMPVGGALLGETDSGGLDADTDPVDVGRSLIPEGWLNMLLVNDVVLDPIRGVAWAAGTETDTLARIHLATGEILDWYALPDLLPSSPLMAVDGLGVVWMIRKYGEHALVRLDPETGEVSGLDNEGRIYSQAVGLPRGGLLLGSNDDSTHFLERRDADGALVAEVEVPGAVTALLALDKGRSHALSLSVSDSDTPIWTVDSESLESTWSCEAPMSGESMARLEDGSFVLVRSTRIGVAHCDAREDPVLEVGTDNKDVFAGDVGFLVLDRVGQDDLAGLNWSLARRFSADLVEAGRPFVTGKHAGFGDIDPATGLLWVNSEGTASVGVFEPVEGLRDQEIRVGTHVENVIPDPESPGRVYYTGRLSQSVGTLDLESGEFLESPERTGWWRSPVLRDDGLWVIDHLTADLHRFDPESMELLERIDVPVPENSSLLFGHLLWHAERGTWFLTHGITNQLLELEDATGRVLGAWALPRATDPSSYESGVLGLARAGDLLAVYNSHEGAIVLVDPSKPDLVATRLLDRAHLTQREYSPTPELLYVSEDASLIFVGGLAFDATTLEARVEQSLPVDRVLGELEPGVFLGWRVVDDTILRLGEGGEILGRQALQASYCGDPFPRHVPAWGAKVLYIRTDLAELHLVDAP